MYEFLSSNETYRKMISLKNRVVRLTYADEFYMDILPAYTDLFSGGTCILVPDRARVSLCPSNPEGFILWFRNRCLTRTRRVMEKAKPVPAQEAVHEKEPLQLAVQLLKRWRDLAFAEECLAPISVVLTTFVKDHGVKPINWTTVAAELQRNWSLPTGKDLGRVFHDHYHSYGLLIDSFDAATATMVKKAAS